MVVKNVLFTMTIISRGHVSRSLLNALNYSHFPFFSFLETRSIIWLFNSATALPFLGISPAMIQIANVANLTVEYIMISGTSPSYQYIILVHLDILPNLTEAKGELLPWKS